MTPGNQTGPRVITSNNNMAHYAIAQLKPPVLLPTTPSTITRSDYNNLDHIVLMDDGSVIKVIEMNADEDAE